MKYSRFETLVLGVGALTIAATIVATYTTGQGVPVPVEILGQIMLLAVLFAAVHWGRKGGFTAAAVATVAYVLLRVPLVAEEGFSNGIAVMILTRAVTYTIVGVMGGELCSRIQYIFARLEGGSNLDEWTNVYNQRFVARTLGSAIGQHTRYGSPFSVVLLSVAPALLAELRPVRQRKILRAVARYIRNDIRLVDEVGRLDDDRFIVILPHTPADGGLVAADRVRTGVQDLLGAKTESIKAEVLGAPGDLEALQGLRTELELPYLTGQAEGAAVGAAQAEASAS